MFTNTRSQFSLESGEVFIKRQSQYGVVEGSCDSEASFGGLGGRRPQGKRKKEKKKKKGKEKRKKKEENYE